jgi:ATP-dependent DNA ligase
MVRREPVGIRLITRRENDLTQRYPLVVEAVNHLEVRSCPIDGEICVLRRAALLQAPPDPASARIERPITYWRR